MFSFYSSSSFLPPPPPLLVLLFLFLFHYCYYYCCCCCYYYYYYYYCCCCYYYCCCFSHFYPSLPGTDDVSLSLLLHFSLATGDVNSILDCLHILLGECVRNICLRWSRLCVVRQQPASWWLKFKALNSNVLLGLPWKQTR